MNRLNSLLGLIVWGAVSCYGLSEALANSLTSRRAPFDAERGVFDNEVPGDVNQDMKFWPFLKDYLFGPEIRTPSEPLPSVKPDWQSFVADDGEAFKWIWFGHSGLYLNFKGTRVLIDLVLGPAASPLSFLVRRYQPPLSTYQDLPEPHLILLSHDHYDHLDKALIEHFAQSKARFLVPLGVGKRLQDFGVPAQQVRELDWYEEHSVENLQLRLAPAQHFSGRGLFDRNQTLWASWILQGAGKTIYFSGDSGYGPHFREIGERFGPIDLAFMDCGQYSDYWPYVHLLPPQVVTAAKDLRAKAITAIHWGVFELALHDWFEPVEVLKSLTEKAELSFWHPQQGQLNRLSLLPPTETWWREHPDFKKRASELKADSKP